MEIVFKKEEDRSRILEAFKLLEGSGWLQYIEKYCNSINEAKTEYIFTDEYNREELKGLYVELNTRKAFFHPDSLTEPPTILASFIIHEVAHIDYDTNIAKIRYSNKPSFKIWLENEKNTELHSCKKELEFLIEISPNATDKKLMVYINELQEKIKDLKALKWYTIWNPFSDAFSSKYNKDFPQPLDIA